MPKSRQKPTPPAVALRGLPPAKPAPLDPQIDFVVMSLMSAIVPMIEAKCGAMSKRDLNTLKRHVEKAVRAFVKGAKR